MTSTLQIALHSCNVCNAGVEPCIQPSKCRCSSGEPACYEQADILPLDPSTPPHPSCQHCCWTIATCTAQHSSCPDPVLFSCSNRGSKSDSHLSSNPDSGPESIPVTKWEPIVNSTSVSAAASRSALCVIVSSSACPSELRPACWAKGGSGKWPWAHAAPSPAIIGVSRLVYLPLCLHATQVRV